MGVFPSPRVSVSNSLAFPIDSSNIRHSNRTYHELDILFAKEIPARKFATTDVNAFDEQQTSELAKKYSVSNLDDRRPSVIPSISRRVSNATGRDAAFATQRSGSVAAQGGQRRPSIAPDVTNYLNTH